jgi:hypothetical protein
MAPTLRVCLLLTATGVVVTATILSTGPATGVSAGTFVGGLGLVAAWTARGPRAPKPQLSGRSASTFDAARHPLSIETLGR